jgi:hypothetical protein
MFCSLAARLRGRTRHIFRLGLTPAYVNRIIHLDK